MRPKSLFASVLFHLVLLASCGINTNVASGQLNTDESMHEWTDLSGKFTVTATVSSWTADKVKLVRDSGKIVELPIKKLSPEGREFLEAWKHLWNTYTHKDDYSNAIKTAARYPEEAQDQLLKIHKEDEDVVSGLLWSSMIATSTAIKRLGDAERILNETILRLRNLHKFFPEKHQLTMASALNNRAIIALRLGKTSRAAALLSEAAKLTPMVHYVIHHNLSTLSSQVRNKNPRFALAGRNLKKVVDATQLAAEEFFDLKPSKHFLYCSQYSLAESDLPQTVSSDTQRAFESLLIWPELTCFVCKGAASRSCDNCHRGSINFKKPVVVSYSARGQPIYQTRVFSEKCTTCNGRGMLDCKACTRGRVQF